MTGSKLHLTATFATWAFFLLIFTKVLEAATQKLNSPVRPALVYAALCALSAGISAIALWRRASQLDFTWAEVAYFALFSALALWILFGYHGEIFPADFARPLIIDSEKPTALGYAVWPTLNFLMALSLFIFARILQLWRTIMAAAIAAFAIEIGSMEVDMLWPAALGETNGRAAGFAKNANVAAMLVVALAVTVLPFRMSERMSRSGIHVLLIAAAAMVFSWSRGGWVTFAAVLTIVCFLKFYSRVPFPSPSRSFAVIFGLALGTTIIVSPITRPLLLPSQQSPVLSSAVTPQGTPLPAPSTSAQSTILSLAFPAPSSDSAESIRIRERISSTLSISEDASTQQRLEAFRFFASLALRHPLGLGTGFTNKFAIGPHNTLLKLAVDNGVFAMLLFMALLCTMTGIAIFRRSPILLAFSAVAWIASQLFHSTFVEPQIFVLFSAALGANATFRDSLQEQAQSS